MTVLALFTETESPVTKSIAEKTIITESLVILYKSLDISEGVRG